MTSVRSIWNRVVEPPPSVRDLLERRQSRLFASAVVTMTAILATVDLCFVFVTPGYLPPWHGYVFLLTTFLLNRSGRSRLASGLWMLMFPTVVFTQVICDNMARPMVSMGFLVLVPALGTLLMPTRAVIPLTALNMAGIALMPVLAPHRGLVFSDLLGLLFANGIALVLAAVQSAHRTWIVRIEARC